MNENLKIPSELDWESWQDDLDTKYAYNLFFGKSIENVVQLFHDNPIERMDELTWVPKKVFQYYIYGFVSAINSDKAAENSDLASVFLNLLLVKEKKEKGCVAEIYKELEPTIKYVVENQDYFDASVEIYGKFSDLENELKKIIGENIGS